MSEFKPGNFAMIIKDEDGRSNVGKVVKLVCCTNEYNVSYQIDGKDWHVENVKEETFWIVEGELEVLNEDTGEVTIDPVYAYPERHLMPISGHEFDEQDAITKLLFKTSAFSN